MQSELTFKYGQTAQYLLFNKQKWPVCINNKPAEAWGLISYQQTIAEHVTPTSGYSTNKLNIFKLPLNQSSIEYLLNLMGLYEIDEIELTRENYKVEKEEVNDTNPSLAPNSEMNFYNSSGKPPVVIKIIDSQNTSVFPSITVKISYEKNIEILNSDRFDYLRSDNSEQIFSMTHIANIAFETFQRHLSIVNEHLLQFSEQSISYPIYSLMGTSDDIAISTLLEAATYMFRITRVESGLIDTLTGQAIALSIENSKVEGSVLIDQQLVPAFQFIMTPANHLNFTLYRAVSHSQPGEDIISLPAGIIFIDAIVYNGADATVIRSADVGVQAKIKDDVPSIELFSANNNQENVNDTVSEGGATLNGSWKNSTLSDGLQSMSVLVDTHDGSQQLSFDLDTDIIIRNSANDVLGQLRVNSDGTWLFIPFLSINHNDEASDEVSFHIQIVDGDGDIAIDSHTITLTDANEEQVLIGATKLELSVNEVDFNEIGLDNITLLAGSDDIVLIRFENDVSQVQINSINESTELSWLRINNNLLEAYIDSALALRLELNAPDTIAARTQGMFSVTATLIQAFPHELANGANSLTIDNLFIESIDQEGLTNKIHVSVTIIDSLPEVTLQQMALDVFQLDENNPDTPQIIDVSPYFSVSTVTEPPFSIQYHLTLNGSNVQTGLYAIDDTDRLSSDDDGVGQGEEIRLNQNNNLIIGAVGGTDYFTFSIDDETGIITYTLLNSLWHPDQNNHNDITRLMNPQSGAFQVSVTVTDNDGDSIVGSINLDSGAISFIDTGPSLLSSIEKQSIHAENTTITGSLLPLIDFNNDGPGFFQLIPSENILSANLPAIDANGETVVYQIIDNTLFGIGSNSQAVIFSLSFNLIGDYIFTLNSPLTQPADGSVLELDFSDVIEVVDADGDTVRLSSGDIETQFVIDSFVQPENLFFSTVGGGAASTLLAGYYGFSSFSPVTDSVEQYIADLLAPGGLLFGSGLSEEDVLEMILTQQGVFSSSDILQLGSDGQYRMAFNSSENFDVQTIDGQLSTITQSTGLDIFNILSFYGYDIDALQMFSDDSFLFSLSSGFTDIVNVLPPGLDVVVTKLLNLSDFGSEDIIHAQRGTDGRYQFSIFFDGDTDGGLVDGSILDTPLSLAPNLAVDFNIDAISYEGNLTNGTLYFSLGDLIDVDLQELLVTTLGLAPNILNSVLINGADVLAIDRVNSAWDTTTYRLMLKANDIGLNDILLGNAIQALGDPSLTNLVSRLLDPDIQVIDTDAVHFVQRQNAEDETIYTLYFSLKSLIETDLPFTSIGNLISDPTDPLAAVTLRGEDILAISTEADSFTWNTDSLRLYFDGSEYELNANDELISGVFDNLIEDVNAISLSNIILNQEPLLFSTVGAGSDLQVGDYDSQTLIQNHNGQFLKSLDLSLVTGGSVTNENINAVHVLSTGNILLGFSEQVNIPGLGLINVDQIIQWDGSIFSNYFTVAQSDSGATNHINSFHVNEGTPNEFLFSLYDDTIINGTTFLNHQVIRYDGANYEIAFDNDQAGINDHTISIDVSSGIASGINLATEIDVAISHLFQPLVTELQVLFDAVFDPIDANITSLEAILNSTTLLGLLVATVNDILTLTTTLRTSLVDGVMSGDLSQQISELNIEISNFIQALDDLSGIDLIIQNLNWAAVGGVTGVRSLAQSITDGLSQVEMINLVSQIDQINHGVEQLNSDLAASLVTDTSLDFTLIDTRVDGLHQLGNTGDYLLSFSQELAMDLNLTVNLDASFLVASALFDLGVTSDIDQLIVDVDTLLDVIIDPVLNATLINSVLLADVDLYGANIWRFHDIGGGEWDTNLYYDGSDHGLDNANSIDTLLSHINSIIGVNSTLADIQDNLELLQLTHDDDINAIHIFDQGLYTTILTGTVGNDLIVGTNDSNSIYGNKGDDFLWGLGGANQFIFDSDSLSSADISTDIIYDFKQGDTILFYDDIFGGASVDSSNIDSYVSTAINNNNTEITVLNASFDHTQTIVLMNYQIQVPLNDIVTITS